LAGFERAAVDRLAPDETFGRKTGGKGSPMSAIISVIALVVSAASLVISAATFANNFLIKTDDLKLMVTNGPQIGGNRQGLTVTSTDMSMTFINMGNRPFSIKSPNLSVEETDEAGKLLHSGQIGQFQVQPFIIKAGEILTKEVSIHDSPLTFKPTETSGRETIKAARWFLACHSRWLNICKH
jgi:hypothetical protein